MNPGFGGEPGLWGMEVTRGDPGLWGMTAGETLSEKALGGTSLSSSLRNAIALQRSFPTFVSN